MRVPFDIATVVVYTFDCLAFGLSSTWWSLKSMLLNNELFSGWLVITVDASIRTVRKCTFYLIAGWKLLEAIYIWSQLACIRKTGCDKYFTACFHAEMRLFRSSILRTDLKCSIQKAHNGTCLQCWWGVFIPLYTWVFCIALLYKMCLEIVVIYSSRNTAGYTVVLWNSWDERELNRLLFLHCLVLWKQSQYFNKPEKP